VQVKRYHAESMKQAMDTAILELGSDAVMIAQNKVRRKGLKNLFSKPLLEVQFAYDPANTPTARRLNASYAVAQEYSLQNKNGENKNPYKSKRSVDSSGQLEQIDERMNLFETMLTDFLNKFAYVKRDITYDCPEEVEILLGKLIKEQVHEEYVHFLAKQAEKLLKQQIDANAVEVIEHFMVEQLGKPEPILHKKFTQKIVLVLGPTGVGKTTSIVKLATDFSVKQKKNVGIINTDTYRIGAQEQLQTYADILGIPNHVAYNKRELESAMEQMSDREIIFVDTAGKRPGDQQHKEDLLEIINILKPEDVLLCLAATASFTSIKEIVDTYGFVENYRVVITKLDETKYRGPIFNISWYANKPLAYITTGQDVPDDIEVADVDVLVKQIIKGNLEESMSDQAQNLRELMERT